MGTGAERSNSLHNFTMPQELRWGNQRFLRCMKVNSNSRTTGEIRGREIDSTTEFLHGSHSGQRFSGYNGGIAAMRGKVMFEDGPKKGEVYKHPPSPASAVASAESELSRDGNLRMRRANLKTPVSRLFSSSNAEAAARGENGNNGGKSPMVNAPKSNSGLSQFKAVEDKPIRLRSGGGAAASGGKKE
ncbi:hypothetical protein ACS0TY_033318 [Phlomoides rotata]